MHIINFEFVIYNKFKNQVTIHFISNLNIPEYTQYYRKIWCVLKELNNLFVCLFVFLLLFTNVRISNFNILDRNRKHSVKRNIQCSWV